MSGLDIERIVTPDKYVWRCTEPYCRTSFSTESEADTAAKGALHVQMHAASTAGKRVYVKCRSGRDIWPAHTGDTGTVTHAYVDQDRFFVKLDRTAKCEGCAHCEGCGQPKPIIATLGFKDMEVLPA